VIHNGIPATQLEPDHRLTNIADDDADDKVIVAIARLSLQKNPLEILRVADQLEDA
jgi:glycosyltransferase involved in cell wall biosynthesis